MFMMDAETHYDNLAPAAHARHEGPAYALKQFHNAQKRRLLEHFVRAGATVLDIACGRGGDVWKYRDLGVARVVGVDVSANELEEAQRRAAAAKLNATFLKLDARRPFDLGARFRAAVCMFGLHYFFESEDIATTFFRNVSSHLEPGGVFVGIVPDGRCVRPVASSAMRIDTRYEAPACFGSAYTMAVADTVTEATRAPEYLVFSNVLERLAAAHGLRPLAVPWLTALDGRVLWHFDPPYGGDLRECTHVFAAFAFEKL